MTRGTAIMLINYGEWSEKISSCEFNGDMYPTRHYEDMLKRLIAVDHTPDFYRTILEFDYWNFKYQNDTDDYFIFYRDIIEHKGKDIPLINFDKQIKCSSDYVFIKIVGKPINFIDTEAKLVVGEPGHVLVFNYGKYMWPERYAKRVREMKE